MRALNVLTVVADLKRIHWSAVHLTVLRSWSTGGPDVQLFLLKADVFGERRRY